MASTSIKNIPFIDFGGDGELIHFAHANAYPPGSYKEFINPFLSKCKIIAMQQRPLWEHSDPQKFNTWQTLADDLILFLDQHNYKNIIGMGHSMGGAISVLAYLKRPDLFSKIVLLDPVVFQRKYNFITNLLPHSLRKKIIPIAKLSQKRKDLWANKQVVYDSFRQKKVFRRFSDTVLQDFVEASTKLTKQGQVTLTYPKAWETQVYITAPSILNDLKEVKIPTLVVKGQSSNVITDEVWQIWQKHQPHAHFLEYPNSGHLVPLEYPKEIAIWILEKLGIKQKD